MQLNRLSLTIVISVLLALIVGCSESTSSGGEPVDSYAANVCVGAKQAASGVFCRAAVDAWATWATNQDTDARNAALEAAGTELGDAWSAAESAAEDAGANCSDLAMTSNGAASDMEDGIMSIADAITEGLDLGQSADAQCASALLQTARDACADVLAAESAHVSDLFGDTDRSTLEGALNAAFDAFSTAWDNAISSACPANAIGEGARDGVAEQLVTLTGELVLNTTVTPELDDTQFTALTPGPTEYLGRTYTPKCMDDGEYRYFVKRGSINKVVMYYMGGGACWNNLTCSVPTCSTAPPADLNPDSGFGDPNNENNPFREWNWVFVSYCTCDIHFGDATVEYQGLEPITVQHLGYHNSQVAEKWAREHFLNPEEVFVTGSSAGAYGAWFNAPLLHEVWPASQIHVLADAGNGVITTDFLQNEFSNWNFVANLPDIPGVLEAITTGDGMPAYTEAVAMHFPGTNWAHYSTMFDGGSGGQTGFYNIMLNNGNPLAGQTWWEGSCAFGETALAQSVQTFEVVPSNYRYYFGTGSRHTMWGNDKVYDDTTGVDRTVVSWVEGMLASRPGEPHADWANVVCEDCGLLLEGDPRPDPLEAPFEDRNGDDVIVCE